jgi:hypothetical protein
MRLRALLVALPALAVAVTGCPTASPPDEACIVGGGVCFEMSNPTGCYEPLDLPCGAGYSCCTMAYGGNIRDGAVIDAPSGAPGTIDAGVASAPPDAARDSAHPLDSATHVDSATHDDGSHVGDAAAHDGEAATDGTAPKG